MMARVRALERKFVRERAELATMAQVNELAGQWSDALDEDRPTPDVLDFAHSIARAGFCLPFIPRAINYLDGCLRSKSLPDRGRLLQMLLPWWTYPTHAWP